MRLTCIVCREFLVPTDDVNIAPCGHFFHYLCWIGWLERSKTCPQCRKKTTEKQIFRMYFNIAEGGGEDVDDAASFNHKLDSLNFNLCLKEKDLASAKEELEKEAKNNKGLREELKKYKGKLDDAQTTLQCMEEKVKYLQQQGKEAEQAKAEVLSLRKKLDRLQRMDIILHGNLEDVQKVLDTTSFTQEGMRSLALFASSLKRALEESKERREQLKEAHNNDKLELRKLKSQINEATKALETANTARQHLEEDVEHLENEKKTLQYKISELEKAIISPSVGNARDKALKRLISESPAPDTLRHLAGDESQDENINTPIMTAPGRSFPASQASFPRNAGLLELDGSPFLGIKPTIVRGSSKSNEVCVESSSLSKMSIFSKRLQSSNKEAPTRPTSRFGETYDGLGGHSKVDEFPEPSSKKIRKLKPISLNTTKPKKALAPPPAGVPKLNQFDGFINLTP